ncbi:MAG: glycosyltransferase family 2 protein [Paludibacteraceae bacterium]|jgi:glycosyltransferase involved in cell wall biosynthesis|nr:glycosyltransferase family 2 protein [Paludibacteraceae bacterium]
MKTLTVFTPAYNRAHTIGRTYESLCRQTSKDFEWLVVDDGSKDNTRELVENWIKEGKIDIRYVYQENQGMHGAHNTAYDYIETELNTCIDSDDFMPDDAVEKIVSFWKEHGSDKYAGIIGLDATEDGKVIGAKFPDGLQTTTLRRYYEELGGSGDKKMIYRTDVVKKYPKYPLFEGERYVGLAYLYNMIDADYELLVSNNVYVIVEYQLDGSSFGMWKQYWNNPKGWAFFRKFDMVQTKSFKRKIMDNIHYVSHSIRSKNKSFLSESPMKLLTFFCILPGVALYFVNKNKVLKNSLYGK